MVQHKQEEELAEIRRFIELIDRIAPREQQRIRYFPAGTSLDDLRSTADYVLSGPLSLVAFLSDNTGTEGCAMKPWSVYVGTEDYDDYYLQPFIDMRGE